MFLEAFFVAPLFLVVCIEVFGAWVNPKNISNSDIFKEDTAVFAKDGFLTKTLSWRKLSSSTSFHTLIHWYVEIEIYNLFLGKKRPLCEKI